MSVLYIVLPLALVVALAAVIAYAWAARRGQFDDLTTPALRILHEDEPPRAGRGTGGAGGTSAEAAPAQAEPAEAAPTQAAPAQVAPTQAASARAALEGGASRSEAPPDAKSSRSC